MKVCLNQCRNCLFGAERLVTDDDAAAILQRTATSDSYFVCHEATVRNEDVMCRGWWDNFRHHTNPGRIAERLGIEPSWRPSGPPADDNPLGVGLVKEAKRAVRATAASKAAPS